MAVLSKDPKKIHPAIKEAVVDSLLNGLSARLAGRGEFYPLIYGAKPSSVLMSEFIVPMPVDERSGDEEADPIRISAHGMDFQVKITAKATPIQIALTGAVYVRILPAEEDLKAGGRLEPVFPLKAEVKADIRARTREGLNQLAEVLPGGRSNSEWPTRSKAIRASVYKALGLQLEDELEPTNETEEITGPESSEAEASEERPTGPAVRGPEIPDGLIQTINPPQKWRRLELSLPTFEFTPLSALEDAAEATSALNAAIAKQLAEWAASADSVNGGQHWGYRRARPIAPSDVKDWNAYLRSVRESGLNVVLPSLDLRWAVEAVQDPLDPERLTVHVAVENWTAPLTKSNFNELEPALFQVSVTASIRKDAHAFLRLDRVKPSYRYNEYLSYPALGFNAGVSMARAEAHNVLTSTWSPRYVLPRIIPTECNVERRIEALAEPDGLPGLTPLISAYEDWLTRMAAHPVDVGLEGPDLHAKAAAERDKLAGDIRCWKTELSAIRSGLAILEKSKSHWSGPGKQANPLGIPFEAWLSMNAAMGKVARTKGYDKWRLFQLAFILASLPAFATRIPAFHSFYTADVERDANAVTLLYFSTGGGKSEAFLGLLLLVLFIDRLRGKDRGVSALMRYPLRLLTLQQARRTFSVLGAGEEVRHSRGHPGATFSLAFWVGGSNTPNWHSSEGYDDVPTSDDVSPAKEAQACTTQPYKSARERWLKLSACPFCGSKDGTLLALRRWPRTGGNALGHFCTASREVCSWNARFTEPTPLPFYIVDEDIYSLAPSVLLGTVDKLATIGQSQGTIRKVFGMFGFAPFLDNTTNRLIIPLKRNDWDGLPGSGARPLFPSYANGDKLFFDPFPALMIQDEAHLLDESLGTFAGLFESALEAAFDALSPALGGLVSHEPGSTARRKLKVIAASATVTDPQRQMRNLYQRDTTVQFPHPGPSIYESFYAAPMKPDTESDDTERLQMPSSDVELRSHWARVYGGMLTNGHRHTVAMAAVLGHYHLMITGLYARLVSGDHVLMRQAQEELVRWVSVGAYKPQFARLLAGADASTLATLIDLHRIALTYVTNKKGGDQVIDTEKQQFEKLHRAAGDQASALSSELISGAISAADIQDIVRRAEKRVQVGEPFPPLNDTLRSVIATSAISHGVDVEEFNAMFFAGIPSDIAEYIQASSRVGRTHVGFSLLVPVPQRYRDRFVVEIHDIFHRFLERMILPAAVDRWAEKALVRVMPSFFQEYVCGIHAMQALCAADDSRKSSSPTLAMAQDARDFLASPANRGATEAFMQRALGLHSFPSPEGRAYYAALLKDQLTRYQHDFAVDRLVNATRLGQFFAGRDALLRPMTSLRDVDQPGVIFESRIDAASRPVKEGMTANVMRFIRRGSGADIDTTDSATEAGS